VKRLGSGASSETALERLAAFCGVEAQFEDARGQVRTATAATRYALLQAMGVAVSDEQSAAVALAELQNHEVSRVLRPVYVLHHGRPSRIAIAMPKGTQQIAWKIAAEDGGVWKGVANFPELAPAEAWGDSPAAERRYWHPPDGMVCGYHQLTVAGEHHSVLIVAPARGWLPPDVQNGERLWGLSAQLYLLRSSHNWGIGDFSDLRRLVEMLTPLGADIVGVNPLHAMFVDDPEQASPYSPASRLLLNVLNIDVVQVANQTPEVDLSALLCDAALAQRLSKCRESRLVDYSEVSTLKLGVLQLLFDAWLSNPGAERWQAFERFRHDAGSGFARDVTFLALREHFSRSACADWHKWPSAYQNADSAEVNSFAVEHRDRITFHACMQYWADSQLAAAACAASQMKVGLYRDLAVGASDGGAETWGNQTAVMSKVHVGAPPDIYNPAGQNWGLPPFNPRALEAEAYRSFIDLIRANMRYAGALRIDHVMGLLHLYCVPAGCPPSEGAYVRYPMDDLIGILKLESVRQRCLVVGEDLGTVPEGFRERMAEAQILSYRVLFFEKDGNDFRSPEEYPRLSVAVDGSHDLPTLRAWWSGADLSLKERLNLFPRAADAEQARAEREQDRSAFVAALQARGIDCRGLGSDQLFEAAHTFLASTGSALALVQLDDISDEEDPVNVPNTSTEHANWRRKSSMDLDAIESSTRLQKVAALFESARS
jgi:4-alpha-glucanotransferase